MAELFAHRYRIERELGRGSFGVVFLGYDTRLSDRAAAIKILHPALNEDPAVIRQFHREAGILATLDHDFIVPVYDVDAVEGRRFIVMRYIPGRTLARILEEEGPQAPEQVFAWLQQIAAGLDYAHGRGVLHRDLKPSNLLWDEDRARVLISDFGLAKAVQASGGSSVSQSQAEMTGTAYYMAPEVIRGKKHTAASDLYSLGCVLYELLAGRPPYEGENIIAITSQHVLEPTPRLALEGDLGQALAEQVAALMAKEPGERPGSAGEVVERVQASVAEKEAARQAEAERVAAEAAAAERAKREAEEKARLAALEKQRREKEAAEAERRRQETERKKRQEEERRRAEAARAAEKERLRKEQEAREQNHEKKPVVWWLAAALVLVFLVIGGFLGLRAMQPQPTPEVVEVVKEVTREVVTQVEVTKEVLKTVAVTVVVTKEVVKEVTAETTPTALSATPTPIPATATPVPPTATPRPPKSTPTPLPVVPAVQPKTNMNVRSGPGTNYPVIGRAAAGSAYRATGKNAAGTWWRIDYNGRQGWLAASLASPQGDLTAVSIVSTPKPPTPRPTSTTSANASFAIMLLEPAPGFTGDEVTLHWQSSQPLSTGLAFEPVVWKTSSSNDLTQHGMSPSGMTEATTIATRMSNLEGRYPLNLQSGHDYYWGVCVAQKNPFKRLYCTDGRLFHYVKASSGGGGGNPTPTPAPP